MDAAFGFGAKEVAEVVWTTNHAEKPFLLHWAMIFCAFGNVKRQQQKNRVFFYDKIRMGEVVRFFKGIFTKKDGLMK